MPCRFMTCFPGDFGAIGVSGGGESDLTRFDSGRGSTSPISFRLVERFCLGFLFFGAIAKTRFDMMFKVFCVTCREG